MLNKPEPPMIMWKSLAENRVRIDDTFWTAWEKGFQGPFLRMCVLVNKAGQGAISVEDAVTLNRLAEELRRFVWNIKESSDGKNALVDGEIVMDTIPRMLVAHYIRNDLHKIILMADIGGTDPQPLDPKVTGIISNCINDMSSFWEKLRSITSIHLKGDSS